MRSLPKLDMEWKNYAYNKYIYIQYPQIARESMQVVVADVAYRRPATGSPGPGAVFRVA
jgi:hypothetical protein